MRSGRSIPFVEPLPPASRGQPCAAKLRRRLEPGNLQDFAVFQCVSQDFTRIRLTGTGSGPLPAIDFKRNLQIPPLF